MTQLLQIVKVLEAEINSKPHSIANCTGGRDYLPANFEAYVLKDIQKSFEPDIFDSVENFSNYMDWYATMVYQPDATAYAWEYSSAAKNVKKIVLSRYTV